MKKKLILITRVSNDEEGVDGLSDKGDYEDDDLKDEGEGPERKQHLAFDNVVDNVVDNVLDSTQWKEYNGPHLIVDARRVRTKGRPRSKMLRNEMDDCTDRGLRCGLCNGTGHNRRSCILTMNYAF